MTTVNPRQPGDALRACARGIPVSLNDTLTGIDRRDARLVVSAVAHTAGFQCPYQETDKRYLNG